MKCSRASLAVAAVLLVGALSSPWTAAQDYPSKSVRIFASAAGGGTDIAARLLAQGLAPVLGQPVVVENRPAVNAIEAAAKSPPDGYTLIVMGVPLWLTPFLQDNVPWDPVRDFAPVSTITRQPTVLVVHPSLPVRSVKELIAIAKSRPGALNYASGGSGTSSHLSAELFKSMAGVNIARVNYKGTGPALTDLLGGQVQLMFSTPGSVTPQIKAGKLRALAVTSPQHSALFPDLPPVSATLPGYELVELLGLFVPAKTPPAVIARWNQGVVQFLSRPDLKEKFSNTGSELVTSSPAEFAAAIKSDMTRLGKVITDAGIRAE